MVEDGGSSDLPLFDGPHIPRIRFRNALERLDLRAALPDCPPQWRDALNALAGAAATEETSGRSDLQRLRHCRRSDWPEEFERTWQRLVGRCLDSHGIPGVLGDELAAAFLLRGGERERARRSLDRHLAAHPRDCRGWVLLADFEPLRGALRCAFHGGPLLDAAGELIDIAAEDGQDPVGPWLLSYAWFAGHVTFDEIARALAAEGYLTRPPLAVPNDARAFAWYLLDAGGRPFGRDAVGVVEARARLKTISPVAFRRYLHKAGGR
jgi:hypothetical protein